MDYMGLAAICLVVLAVIGAIWIHFGRKRERSVGPRTFDNCTAHGAGCGGAYWHDQI
jgi:hypothetical protein